MTYLQEAEAIDNAQRNENQPEQPELAVDFRDYNVLEMRPVIDDHHVLGMRPVIENRAADDRPRSSDKPQTERKRKKEKRKRRNRSGEHEKQNKNETSESAPSRHCAKCGTANRNRNRLRCKECDALMFDRLTRVFASAKQSASEGDDENDENLCIICVDEYEAGDELVVLPCIHRFHDDCIEEWLQQHDTCPICKIELR